jgi:hypothetical protein
MWQEGFFIDHRFPWRISLLRAISSFWSDRRQLSCAPILRIQRLSKDRSGFFLRALCVLCGKVCSDFPDPRLSAYIRGKLLLFRFSALFASFAVKKFCSIARSTFVFPRALCGKKTSAPFASSQTQRLHLLFRFKAEPVCNFMPDHLFHFCPQISF